MVSDRGRETRELAQLPFRVSIEERARFLGNRLRTGGGPREEPQCRCEQQCRGADIPHRALAMGLIFSAQATDRCAVFGAPAWTARQAPMSSARERAEPHARRCPWLPFSLRSE